MSKLKYIIHAAERAFAKGVCTPAGRLGTMINVRFAIPNELAKKTRHW
jgi:hypothetical protein